MDLGSIGGGNGLDQNMKIMHEILKGIINTLFKRYVT